MRIPFHLRFTASSLLSTGDIKAFLAANAELCYSPLSRLNPLKHRKALMESGIGLLILGDIESAAKRFAKGLQGQHRKLVSRICTYGYPDDIVEWASQNEENFTSEARILALIESFVEHDQHDDIVTYFVGLYFVDSPRENARYADLFLTHIKSISNDSYGALQSAIRRALYPRLSFDPSENFQPDGPRFIKDRILHVFEQSLRLSPTPFADSQEIDAFFGEDLDTQSRASDELAFLKQSVIGPIVHGVRHLIKGEYAKTQDLLKPFAKETAKEFEALGEKTGPKKVFIGGYGWSGSGVIYDIFRGFSQVRPMFGARAAPFLNEDADVEPMIHQGPGGLLDLFGMARKAPQHRKMALKKFLRLYVILGPHQDYFEYKTLNCNENLIIELGIERYYQLLTAFVYELACGLDKKSELACDAAASSFEHRIYNSLFLEEDICVLFNNSVNTQNVELLGKVKGNCHFVGVDRNFSDQYLDQKRENQFFSDAPVKFLVRKAVKLRNFYRGARAATQTRPSTYADLKMDTVFFEELVTDREIVKDICTTILGEYDEAQAYQHFDPSISINNIGKSREGLSISERAQISTFSFLLARLSNQLTASRSK
ncbi:hypothetical protein [Pacificibacter sp.]|uniref:hypothetical protein n=1 Tax=Pacificibacter sp. TaxID=1917866 RepID=UPI00321ACF03